MAFALLATFQLTVAQQPAKRGGNAANFFNTSPFGGQNGHIQSGNFGSFGINDRWIGIGQPAGTPTSLYGMRIQDATQVGTLSINEDAGTGIKDLELQWGIEEKSRFRLNFLPNIFGPVLNIMTAQSSGRVGFNEDDPDNYSTRLVVIADPAGNDKFAIYGENNPNNGIYGQGKGVGTYGVGSNTSSPGTTYGTYGSANGANSTYGVYGRATNSSSSLSAGVYGTIFGSGTNNYAGYFAGDVVVTGSFSSGSDRRLKQDIKDETNVMDKLMKVRPATYLYRQEGKFKEMHLAKGDQHGFIAQELEEVFPELVNESAFVFGQAQGDETPSFGEADKTEQFDFKTVNYQAMIPILTKGIQEQQTTILEQEARIAAQDERIEKLEQALALNSDKQGSSLDANAIKGNVLYQNSPNPFDVVTEIRYELATDSRTAEMIVFDMNGRQVRKFSNLKAGPGSIQLEGSQLESGMYLYSLLVDGQEIDTKRMILTE